MAKLFNKIRKTLVSEKPSVNRTTNYLKYAIGEIVLVVIGILIALSINNWNENRLESSKKEKLFNSLLKDFKTNEKLLLEKITYTNGLIYRLEKFLVISDKPALKTPRDSIKYYASGGFRSNSFKPFMDTYSEAVNTGDLGLITNINLITSFNDFLKNLNFYDRHSSISIDLFYKGAIFELRKELGNLANLDNFDQFGKRKTFNGHRLSYGELLEFISRPHVFATFHNLLTVQYNFKETFENLLLIDKKIITQLESELNNKT